MLPQQQMHGMHHLNMYVCRVCVRVYMSMSTYLALSACLAVRCLHTFLRDGLAQKYA
jgi:hypothetical protein